MKIFETLNKTQLPDNILLNLVAFLEKNVKNFPSLTDTNISYSYEPEYKIIALWWGTGSNYDISSEFYDSIYKFSSYVIDYDTEENIKGIEIFDFNLAKFE